MFERFTKTARFAVVGAHEQARELKSPRIDVEHVLLGVLSTADNDLTTVLDRVGLTYDDARARIAENRRSEALGEEDAEALKSIGIDLDAVRESLEATFGDDALDRAVPEERRGWFGRRGGHIPFTPGAKKVLELSLREALAHKDDHIASEHILLGVLRAPSDKARAVIEEHVAVAELRRQIMELLDRAA